VVLYGHQQAEFAVALYSCLLHNIPYIPVDCIYPQERLKEICQLANAPSIMMWPRKIHRDRHNRPVLAEQISPTSCSPPAAPENRKVQIGRESVWHFMKWVSQDFSLPEKPVLMNHAVFSFDLSLIPCWQIWLQAAHCAERERRYRGGKLAGSPESERGFRLGFYPSFAYQRLLSPSLIASICLN
jgi:D-alanine--poly(phosphoribitol) ligase subunit 1